MPAWNLGEILSNATARLGRRADVPLSTASLWANVAHQELCDRTRPGFLERIAISSTTSGENRIDLPGDYAEPISFALSWSWSTTADAQRSRKTLPLLDTRQYEEEGALPVGEPESVVFFNNWVELHPSPDSGYSLHLRYHSNATDMTALTDVPSVSSAWRFGIVLRTEALLHEWLGDWEGAAAAQNRFIGWAAGVETDHGRRQHHGNWGMYPVMHKGLSR